LYRSNGGRIAGRGLLRGGSLSILPGRRWSKAKEKASSLPEVDGLEESFIEAEERHGRRRKSSARVYEMIERLFMLALLLFLLLASWRFISAVTPALIG
jgi:hypothetical protein